MIDTQKRTACDRWLFTIRSAVLMLTAVLILALVILFGAQNAQAQWGDLTGTFVLDGPAPAPVPLNTEGKDAPVCNGAVKLFDESVVVGKEGGLANVVIYVRSKDVKIHESYQKVATDGVVLDNKDCRFEPHIVPLWLSQTLLVKNPDPIVHNCKGDPLGDVGFNPTIQPGGEFKVQFNKLQSIPVPVNCNIHTWMKGYVVVRDNPYTAITDQAGKFTIKNLPAGELEFQAWHEKAGYLEAKPEWKRGRFTLKIADGKASDLGTIKVKPAKLKL